MSLPLKWHTSQDEHGRARIAARLEDVTVSASGETGQLALFELSEQLHELADRIEAMALKYGPLVVIRRPG